MRKVKILTSVVLALSGVLTVGVVQKGKAEGTVPGISFYQNSKTCKEILVKAAENAAKDTKAKIAAARLEGAEPFLIWCALAERVATDFALSEECFKKTIASVQTEDINGAREAAERGLIIAMTGLVRFLVVEEYATNINGPLGQYFETRVDVVEAREELTATLGDITGLTGGEITAIAREAITSYGVFI